MSSSKFDIVVYGATGFTGQLVAEYLAAHYKADSGLKWAMAGRSQDKLAAVRDAIGAPEDIALIVADAGDPASLKAMVAQTKSVITTVGPYLLYGNELLAACVAAGVDYFDLCGEPIWMRQKIDAARGGCQRKRGAHRVLLRLRFTAVRAWRVLCPERSEEGVWRTGRAGEGACAQNERHAFRRHGREHARHCRGDHEGFEPRHHAARSLRPDAGIRRSETAARQQAGTR